MARAIERSIRASGSTTTCSARSRTTACSIWPSAPMATSRSTSTTRSRTSPSSSGRPSPRRSAIEPGSPGSGRARVPMDEALAHGGRRRRRPSLCRHRPAVPRRAGRRPAAPAHRARARIVLADGGCHAPSVGHRAERPSPRRGRLQGAGPRAPSGLRHRSTPRRAWPRPRASSSERVAPGGGRRLRRGQPGEHRPGADARRCDGHGRARRGGAAWRRRAHRAGRRRRRTGDGQARCAWPVGPDPGLAGRRPAVPRDLSRAAAPVRGQRRGRRADARRRARPDRPARSCADPAAHRLEPGRAHVGRTRCSTASTTARTSTSSIRTPAIRAATPASSSSPRPTTARRSSRRSRATPSSASSSTRNGAAPTGCACWPTSSICPGRLMLRRRVIPCLDVADGRVVKGTRFVDLVDAGRSARARRALRGGGRRRARLPRHHGRPGAPVHAPRHRRADGPPSVHPADRRRRRADGRGDARRAPGRRRQGLVQHRGGGRPDAHQPLRGTVRAPGGRRRDRRAGGRARRAGRGGSGDPWPGGRHRNQGLPVLAGRRQGRPRSDRARRRRLGPTARSSSVPASCSSPRSTATGPGRASTPTCCGRSRRPWACRSSRRGVRQAPTISSRAVRDGGADAVLAASIFHRRIHSIADVKAAMAAAGLPIRLAPQAVA